MKRAREALQCSTSRRGNESTRPAQAFPLCCIEDYLNSQPIIKLAGTTVREVHNVMAKIVTVKLNSTSKTSTAQSQAIMAPSFSCTECGNGEYVVDVANGMTCCSKCGVVNASNLNFVHPCREAFAPVLPCTRDHWKRRGAVSPNERKEMILKESIEHWSASLHMSEDDVESALRLAMSISEKCKVVSKTIACLLFVRNEPNISQWLETQNCNVKVKLPVVLSFGECTRCGTQFASVKAKRHHRCAVGS